MVPSFEEYTHRSEQTVPFYQTSADYTYTAQDVMDFYQDKEIKAMVLVNPDNPSGNYISRRDVVSICEYCQQRDILFILDESFVDFADEPDATMLRQELLDQYQKLVVIKSISKSYGVPGLRLGILASGNRELIGRVSETLPIWNINSFGEYFLQIFEKYQADYQEALARFRVERNRMFDDLKGIRQLRVVPSQSNYFICEITDGMSATQIAEILLNRYNVLIKDLSSKKGMEGRNYIRVAIKTLEENMQLVNALRHILR